MWRGLTLLLLALPPALSAAEPLPFVDDSGLVRAELRYSDVVRQLGVSPVSRIDVGPGERREDGDHLFEYPAPGLAFTIRADERKAADPRVASMRVTAPAAGRTAQGLAVGQPEAEARALLRQRYRVLRDEAGVLAAGDATGATRRVVVAEFQRGAVSALSFDTSDPPAPPSRLWRAVKAAFGVVLWLATLIVVGSVAWLLRRFFERRVVGPPGGGSPVLHGLATVIGLGALLAIGVGVVILREGGYGGLAGLVIAAGGLAGLLVALVLLTRSRSRSVSVVATVALVGALLASVLEKFLH